MKRFLTIIKYVLMGSIGSLIVFWIIQYNFFHDISRFSINRPADPEIVEIYEARGRFENEKGLEAILKFMNEEYFSKPFVRTREIYIAGAPIIMGWNSDYPSEDVHAHFMLDSMKKKTIISGIVRTNHYYRRHEEEVAELKKTTIQTIRSNDTIEVRSIYNKTITPDIFIELYFMILKEELIKNTEYLHYQYIFDKRNKVIHFHFYDYGRGLTAKMEDLR